MRKIIFTIGVLSSCAVYSQVGINTETPKATLEVTGKPSDLTEADGIIAPRLKGSELKAKDALYTANQKASLVYVTEALASANTTAKTINVTSIGYFYFDGSIWQKLNAGNIGGTGIEPWYNAATNQPADSNTQNIFQTGKVSVGKNASGGTLSIYGDNIINSSPFHVEYPNINASGEKQWIGIKSNLASGAFTTASLAGDIGLIFSTDDNAQSYSRNGLLVAPHGSDGSSAPFGLKVTEQGMVAINAQLPTETLDIDKGTLRIRKLPANGSLNSIYTNSTGNSSVNNTTNISGLAKTQPFNATRTVVADKNGVLGYVDGIAQSGIEPWHNAATLQPADSNTQNIYQMGNVGIGISSPRAPLDIRTTAFDVAILERANSTPSGLSGGPYLAFRRNESDDPLVNVAVSAKQALGAITFDGNTGNGYPVTGIRGKASIGAWADEAFTPTSKGAYLDFSTVANGTAQDSVRMRIASNGNVGIGTTTPATKLEVNNGTTNGAIKIVDGTQGDGKVLMSDANGVGTWQSPASIRPTILGVFPTTDTLVKSDGGTAPKYSEIYIDLSPGKWIVNSGATIYAGIANARYIQNLYLSSSQTSVAQVGFTHLGPAGNNFTVADVISSGSDVNDPNSTQNFISGSSVINVTVSTRIYLLFQNKNTDYWSFPTKASENYFYAIPAN